MSQAIMSHDWLSKNFEMQYDGYNSQTKVIVNLPKKIPFLGKGNLGPIWSKIMQPCPMIHSLKIFLKFFGMMRHQTKVALVTFPKELPFWAIQAHLTQNYATNCSRGFQKHSSMMWCNSYTLVIFVNFPKKFSFWARGNQGKNYATLYS